VYPKPKGCRGRAPDGGLGVSPNSLRKKAPSPTAAGEGVGVRVHPLSQQKGCRGRAPDVGLGMSLLSCKDTDGLGVEASWRRRGGVVGASLSVF